MDKMDKTIEQETEEQVDTDPADKAEKKKRQIPRDYQVAISRSVLEKGSTLVVLPTGLGKTLVALLVMEEKLKSGKVLFLSPTKALVEQHVNTIRDYFQDIGEELVMITGNIQKKKRQELWKKRIIVSTPQTVANDLKAMNFDFSLCVFDEAHRAVGKYAYTAIAEACREHNTTALALTASPGSKLERINEINQALGIVNIQVRTYEDSDVSKYVQKKDVKWVIVELGQKHREAVMIIRGMIDEQAKRLKRMGIFGNYLSKKGLVEIRMKVLAIRSNVKYNALSVFAMLFNLNHMLELLETQSVYAFREYLKSIAETRKSKAVERILNDKRIRKVLMLIEGIEHPKLGKLLEILLDRKEKKLMVFAQYRSQVAKIVEFIKANGINGEVFLGKGKGFSQKTQSKTIERFRNNEFSVLVSSSIGEEGLDIPSVDTVVFYEPVPSEIRSIQRKGRAGRAKVGEVVILVTKDTRDQAFFWVANSREKKMGKILDGMQGKKPKLDIKQAAEIAKEMRKRKEEEQNLQEDPGKDQAKKTGKEEGKKESKDKQAGNKPDLEKKEKPARGTTKANETKKLKKQSSLSEFLEG